MLSFFSRVSMKLKYISTIRQFSTTRNQDKGTFYDPSLRSINKSNRHLVRGSPSRSENNYSSDSTFMPIFAYEISRAIELNYVSDILKRNNSLIPIIQPNDINSYALSYSLNCSNDKFFFVFSQGTVVFWNFTHENSKQIIRLLQPSLLNPLPLDLREMEELRFSIFSKSFGTHLVGEDIYLCHPNPTDSDFSHILDMISLSDALSHSVKLNSIENNFDKLAQQMEPWIQQMRSGLPLTFPSREVFQKTGDLFTLRHLLNITASMSDTPDVYWERPELEALFKELRSKLNINSRVKILNSKLDMCFELADILSNHLQARHSTRLEWMIIILILVEVVFETIHFVKSHSHDVNKKNA